MSRHRSHSRRARRLEDVKRRPLRPQAEAERVLGILDAIQSRQPERSGSK